jgi:hypothetical protein
MRVGILALGLAGCVFSAPAMAEIVKQGSFVGDVSQRALKPLDDGSPMAQVFVAVSLVSGGAPSMAQLPDAARFAVRAGCGTGQALTTILSGRDATSANYEILCKRGR